MVNEAGDRVLAVGTGPRRSEARDRRTRWCAIARASRRSCCWTARPLELAATIGGRAAHSRSKQVAVFCRRARPVTPAGGEFDEERRRRGFATPPAPRARPKACSIRIARTTFTRCARSRADAFALTAADCSAGRGADVPRQWLGASFRGSRGRRQAGAAGPPDRRRASGGADPQRGRDRSQPASRRCGRACSIISRCRRAATCRRWER